MDCTAANFMTVCSRVSQFVARNLRSRQGAWNTATQNRISMTSAVLSTIKNIKMLGLQGSMSAYIESLRREELSKARSVRWMMFAYNASANALGIFAPVITLVLYTVIAWFQGYSLNTETAFTTTAILGMVTHPANMVMTIVPRVIASFSSFERIQSFLLEQELVDGRNDDLSVNPTHSAVDIQNDAAIALQDVSVRGSSSKGLLQDITFAVPRGTLCICAGPTASGKTTLARVLLGELGASHGSIAVSSRQIGYCAQAAWLPNTTIKQAIVLFSRSPEIDELWYAEVIRLCCLQSDLKNMPGGDETSVGSKGMNLSGGQRQRIVSSMDSQNQPSLLTKHRPLLVLCLLVPRFSCSTTL